MKRVVVWLIVGTGLVYAFYIIWVLLKINAFQVDPPKAVSPTELSEYKQNSIVVYYLNGAKIYYRFLRDSTFMDIDYAGIRDVVIEHPEHEVYIKLYGENPNVKEGIKFFQQLQELRPKHIFLREVKLWEKGELELLSQ